MDSTYHESQIEEVVSKIKFSRFKRLLRELNKRILFLTNNPKDSGDFSKFLRKASLWKKFFPYAAKRKRRSNNNCE